MKRSLPLLFASLMFCVSAGASTASAEPSTRAEPFPMSRASTATAAAPGALSQVAPQAASSAERSRWAWPLDPRPAVKRVFDRPTDPWGQGHRGVDLAPKSASLQVFAVADGVVTHVGVIAGRGTVSITHPDGVRSTYEPVDASVREGESIRRSQAIGTLTTSGSHCAPATCLHLGALRGSTYLDPMLFLQHRPIILLPLGR